MESVPATFWFAGLVRLLSNNRTSVSLFDRRRVDFWLKNASFFDMLAFAVHAPLAYSRLHHSSIHDLGPLRLVWTEHSSALLEEHFSFTSLCRNFPNLSFVKLNLCNFRTPSRIILSQLALLSKLTHLILLLDCAFLDSTDDLKLTTLHYIKVINLRGRCDHDNCPVLRIFENCKNLEFLFLESINCHFGVFFHFQGGIKEIHLLNSQAKWTGGQCDVITRWRHLEELNFFTPDSNIHAVELSMQASMLRGHIFRSNIRHLTLYLHVSIVPLLDRITRFPRLKFMTVYAPLPESSNLEMFLDLFYLLKRHFVPTTIVYLKFLCSESDFTDFVDSTRDTSSDFEHAMLNFLINHLLDRFPNEFRVSSFS